MVTTFGLELVIQLWPVFQLYITVGPQFRGQTRGESHPSLPRAGPDAPPRLAWPPQRRRALQSLELTQSIQHHSWPSQCG